MSDKRCPGCGTVVLTEHGLLCPTWKDKAEDLECQLAVAVEALKKIVVDHQAGSKLSCCDLDMLAQEALSKIALPSAGKEGNP